MTLRRILFLIISITISSCIYKPDLKSDAVFSHDQFSVYRNGIQIGEIRFLKEYVISPKLRGQPLADNPDKKIDYSKPIFRGIIFINTIDKTEKWIFPKKGWELFRDSIRFAEDQASPLYEIETKWRGGVLGSKNAALTMCYDVHFSNDSSGIIFTTIGLFRSNPIWEYSFSSGKTRKIGRVLKKNE